MLTRKIVIAVDQSPQSAHAVQWASEHCLKRGDKVLLLHVRPPTSVFDRYGDTSGARGDADMAEAVTGGHVVTAGEKVQKFSDAYQEICQRETEKAAEPLLAAGFAYDIKIVEDDCPKERICTEVEDSDADLLIIASRGMGAIKRTLLGSVSEYCTKYCHAPVLVVKKDTEELQI
eukprot:TRINITY_DN1841_c0_g1_i1.p1 TRINITY_DN1841_c0_g1~~TRINITY_DN1841_c0_g1_i1.p1  ORF type:complete len:175 (+),score=28.93 TRINITY_DN1841_c0_g1_i1:91-615(+)